VTEVTIHVRASRAAVRAVIARIPEVARGGGATANLMMARTGVALLDRIKAAFLVKSKGGTDDGGDRWRPLLPKTAARSQQKGKQSKKKQGERGILRDTGALLASLSPDKESRDQVFRVGPGSVTVGTNRRGALAHHGGVPGRLPQRRLWPAPKKWPGTWWQPVLRQVQLGIVDIAVRLIREAGTA
jgi:hypothetical protein